MFWASSATSHQLFIQMVFELFKKKAAADATVFFSSAKLFWSTTRTMG